MTTPTTIRIFASPEGVARHAARTLIDVCASMEEGPISLCLSGGSTPALLYTRLAEDCAEEIPWHRIHIFFGDERCVPPAHEDSNFHLAVKNLLARVPVPVEQVHRMPADAADLAAAAFSYEEEVRHSVPTGPSGEPAFDLVWLGLGEDGHTASLFQGSEALADTEHLVSQAADPGGSRRMTFTLPLINSARRVQFLVTGARKAWIVRQILGPPPEEAPVVPLPAARVRPLYGTTEWLLDREAAAELNDPGLIA